jgi:hypothetical protein
VYGSNVRDVAGGCTPFSEQFSEQSEKVTTSECAMTVINGAALPSCFCSGDGAAALFGTGAGTDCSYYGRDRLCLYTTAEFPGCDLAAPITSCAAPCDDLEMRLAADAARSLNATLSVRCAVATSAAV